jgi:hypothetical protein
MKPDVKHAVVVLGLVGLATFGALSDPKPAKAWCSPYADCGYTDFQTSSNWQQGGWYDCFDRYTNGCDGPSGIGHCQMTWPGSGMYVCNYGAECYAYQWCGYRGEY